MEPKLGTNSKHKVVKHVVVGPLLQSRRQNGQLQLRF